MDGLDRKEDEVSQVTEGEDVLLAAFAKQERNADTLN